MDTEIKPLKGTTMIEKASSYKVGDQIFATLEEAQAHELGKIAISDASPPNDDMIALIDGVIENLLKHSERVVDILSTTPKSRVRARKANGATRKPRTRQAPPNLNDKPLTTKQPELT